MVQNMWKGVAQNYSKLNALFQTHRGISKKDEFFSKCMWSHIKIKDILSKRFWYMKQFYKTSTKYFSNLIIWSLNFKQQINIFYLLSSYYCKGKGIHFFLQNVIQSRMFSSFLQKLFSICHIIQTTFLTLLLSLRKITSTKFS